MHWLTKFSIRLLKQEGFWKRRRKLGCGLSSPKKTPYPRSNRHYEINTCHVGPEIAENSAKRSAKASISILLTTNQKTFCKNYKTHISPIGSQENFSCLKTILHWIYLWALGLGIVLSLAHAVDALDQ